MIPRWLLIVLVAVLAWVVLWGVVILVIRHQLG